FAGISASAAAAVAAVPMDVAFFDGEGKQSSLSSASFAKVMPPAVFVEHSLLRKFKNQAKNAYSALARHAKKLAELDAMKPGGLHSLELKFEGVMKKDELAKLNKQIHEFVLP